MNIDDFKQDTMSDDDIRILGSDDVYLSRKKSLRQNGEHEPGKQSGPGPKRRWWLVALLIAVLTVVCIVIFSIKSEPDKEGNKLPSPKADAMSVKTLKGRGNEQVCHLNAVKKNAYALVSDTVVNDIELRSITPVEARMDLYVGNDPCKARNVVLAVHAADLRGDDGTPAGAFVYKGDILSKGHSKYGFCAIVNGEVSIGRQTETPLFERAVEQGGSFFRQYSIVSNGKMVPIPPKGKSVRRALCLIDDTFVVIESLGAESFHDFSQALQDMGVSEALALVGSTASIMWRDEQGRVTSEGGSFGKDFPMENFLIWVQ